MIKKYIKQNLYITPHFNLLEFACKDGNNEIYLDNELCYQLENVRKYFNKPIKILSGYRTKVYNEKINGAKNSYHCMGLAVDFKIDGINTLLIGLVASRFFNGTIIYKDFVHCDLRDNLYKQIEKEAYNGE